MASFLGIDTSNYTSSAALYNTADGVVRQQKKPLPVAQGRIGLRQSDAVFAHVKQLGAIVETLFRDTPDSLAAVGVSARPTNAPGSYMPCFLAGEMAARCVAASHSAPLYVFSHQAGHIAAALYATGTLRLINEPFLAFHISGGTTDCLLVRPRKADVFDVLCICKALDLHAGQAVDRVGHMLGLPFPAGPALEELALRSARVFDPKPAFKGVNPCLSGLENQCRTMLEKGEAPCDIARYCLDFLAVVILTMTREALKTYPGLPLVYAGGVMANTLIRAAVEREYTCYFAPPVFSADNAAGTAVLAAVAHGYL
ncbi:MAG: peptidase M22 [Oscillospiraceae bacterium]|jgi:N6-L-threonylcarbamoyladenine synthase|nr:peptidase M22 [Oscillospiraceae bacterium]